MKKHALITGFVLMCIVGAWAQSMPSLPIDQQVRYGRLDNGLTYYIRHNELPKERADFYIAQRVGSMQEEDNQAGLAHFLEHMAFNGSVHFPENGLIKYLESIGVKFGVNLNAYTSFDETVYNISDVPVTKTGAVDSCLLILRDWSNGLLLTEEDILKERGVIREEMRSRNEASYRQYEKLLPQIMPGSKYAKRMPIGTEEVVMNFKPEELRDYYHKWYRPDLQGIIIVGDIDVDVVEQQIKKVFADVPAPVNPAKRIYYDVEDNIEPLVGIVTDKESTYSIVNIDFKHKPLPREQRGTMAGVVVNYYNGIASRIVRERMTDLMQQANPPFVQAGGGNETFAVACTEDSWNMYAIVRNNDVETALKTITREAKRIDQFGFTAGEYDRAKNNLLTVYESQFNEREKTLNSRYSREYVSHFTDGGYIPGIELEYNMMKTLSENVTIDLVNQFVQHLIGDSNIVIYMLAPEKEDVVLPSKEQLLTWFNEARKEEVQAPAEEIGNEPLLSEEPKGGTIVSETINPVFDVPELTLSNGVKVAIKTTQLKSDEILMAATSPGGSSLFDQTQQANINLYSNVISVGGVGNFSQTELNKALAGKRVRVSPNISLISEGMSGSSSVKDFETMLQLIYLYFTAPRMDEAAFQSLLVRQKSMLENQDANPEIALSDTMMKEMYVDQVRHQRMHAKDLEKINYQTIMNWYKDRYADAGDFTFVFTGNIDLQTAKPLIAKYLGALPNIHRKETFAPVNEDYNKGLITNEFNQKVENVKSTIMCVYWAIVDDNLKNRIEMDMLTQILNIVYTEKVREEEGGTYGVNVGGNIAAYPKGKAMLQIVYETEPSKVQHLNTIVRNEFERIAKEGPGDVNFNKVKEYLLKKQAENAQQNSYWHSLLLTYYRLHADNYTDYLKLLNEMQPVDIQRKAQELLKAGNRIEGIMNGVKE
ncbi:MAG: insulinase family protein [Candidatus Symbiothrix sp.]|jgi:zinc protease|nr:insulinase family protein [Candidatus Symbiothrix sp.]